MMLTAGVKKHRIMGKCVDSFSYRDSEEPAQSSQALFLKVCFFFFNQKVALFCEIEMYFKGPGTADRKEDDSNQGPDTHRTSY